MKRYRLTFALLALTLACARFGEACPFCGAVAPTFTQELKGADVAIITELVALPPRPADTDEPFVPGLGETIAKSKFRIIDVVKGAEHLAGAKSIDAIYFGESPVGTQFMMMGLGPLPAEDEADEKSAATKKPAKPFKFGIEEIAWGTPIELNTRTRQYIADLQKLPESGPDRLAFFQNYLQDKEEMLQRDSYDEFAIAPYADVKALAPRMNHAQLLEWIGNPEVSPSHRRLYFTMLGVCGSAQDLPLLEGWMKSSDRKVKTGLDAMIGCYLALKGAEGTATVEELFFKNPATEFIDINAAINAIRVAEEAGLIPRDRAAAALRHVLDRAELADLVIPDLARWEDWTVKDRLVELFVKADPEDSWVRTPVVRYLQACPLPDAKVQLTKLEKIDPDAVQRAKGYLPLGGPGGKKITRAPGDGDAAGGDDGEPGDPQGADTAEKRDGAIVPPAAGAKNTAGDNATSHGGAKVPGGTKLARKTQPTAAASASSIAGDTATRDRDRMRTWVVALLVGLAVCLVAYGALFVRHNTRTTAA